MDATKPGLISRLRNMWAPPQAPVKKVRADFGDNSGTYNHLFVYTGEKNLGEIGPIRNYKLDYGALRMRSWQAYHESEIVQTIMNRYNMWVIGKGLKLQSEPVKLVLESEGITLDFNTFCKTVESRFNVWAKSKASDYAGMENVHIHAGTAKKNSILGGDVLVVMRYDNGVTVQLIDGAHIQSPVYGTEMAPQKLENGNRIVNGIEMDGKGQHVRYFVRQADYTFKTIEAKGKKSGLQMAFLVYGLKYRIDNVRGVPLFAVVLETLKKLERYKEATVGSAEERQKIVMQIVHDLGSTGENPQNKNLAKAFNANADVDDDIPVDVNGEQLANTISVSTNKQTYNMPPGSKLEGLESKNELYFKDFYTINFDIICAAVNIPPNVASSKYDSNFSASRAALKDWENTLDVSRSDFAFQYYQNIFNFWLECEILNNKIQAPGYLAAKFSDNQMVLDSYRMARFVGTPVPHIDPLKEVKAEREKLGTTGASIPLTTAEAATEALGGGEFSHNVEQYAIELEKTKGLNIVEIIAEPREDNTDDDDKKKKKD
jgi:capsid protein